MGKDGIGVTGHIGNPAQGTQGIGDSAKSGSDAFKAAADEQRQFAAHILDSSRKHSKLTTTEDNLRNLIGFFELGENQEWVNSTSRYIAPLEDGSYHCVAFSTSPTQSGFGLTYDVRMEEAVVPDLAAARAWQALDDAEAGRSPVGTILSRNKEGVRVMAYPAGTRSRFLEDLPKDKALVVAQRVGSGEVVAADDLVHALRQACYGDDPAQGIDLRSDSPLDYAWDNCSLKLFECADSMLSGYRELRKEYRLSWDQLIRPFSDLPAAITPHQMNGVIDAVEAGKLEWLVEEKAAYIAEQNEIVYMPRYTALRFNGDGQDVTCEVQGFHSLKEADAWLMDEDAAALGDGERGEEAPAVEQNPSLAEQARAASSLSEDSSDREAPSADVDLDI